MTAARHDDQLPAPEVQPGQRVAEHPRLEQPLHRVVDAGEADVPAEREDHRVGVQRPQPPERGPRQPEVRRPPGDLQGDPDARPACPTTAHDHGGRRRTSSRSRRRSGFRPRYSLAVCCTASPPPLEGLMVELCSLAAFVAGLLGSVHCVGMCGAFAAACARAPRRASRLAPRADRLTYALLGAARRAASVGCCPGPPGCPAALAALLLVWFALALGGARSRTPPPSPRPGPRRRPGRSSARRPAAQFLFGVVNGFLPCGLVYSALSLAVAVASPGWGALTMLAFGAGTLPALSLTAWACGASSSRPFGAGESSRRWCWPPGSGRSGSVPAAPPWPATITTRVSPTQLQNKRAHKSRWESVK